MRRQRAERTNQTQTGLTKPTPASQRPHSFAPAVFLGLVRAVSLAKSSYNSIWSPAEWIMMVMIIRQLQTRQARPFASRRAARLNLKSITGEPPPAGMRRAE